MAATECDLPVRSDCLDEPVKLSYMLCKRYLLVIIEIMHCNAHAAMISYYLFTGWQCCSNKLAVSAYE